MLVNFSIVVIIALIARALFEKIKIPGILGMILVGILLGPHCINYIDASILNDELGISKDLRNAALIIILIRAGLGISKKTLNKVGIPAATMSCIPGIFEGATITIVAHYLLKMDFITSGILGFIIAAVSPAVVVPQMLDLKERKFGQRKEIPTLILAGASVDDVFAITIFSSLLAMKLGASDNLILQLGNIPLSIFTGVLIGTTIGFALHYLFKFIPMRATKKAILFMVVAILFNNLEHIEIFPIASLLGIMAVGFILLELDSKIANELANKFNKAWILAEVVLFVLIGAAVDIKVMFNAGLIGLIIIIIGLLARSIGVYIALIGSQLNKKEKLFCAFAYLPKATVQAAIGAIPLSEGVEYGDKILAIAVLSIIVTAPLGSFLIKFTGERFLECNKKNT
ncbi:cation:proton antiporter [Lentisphaerota bacterium WC36G]|nr:cation:proton antiporter [Lentisphaerae bacterium WC36]